LADFELFCKTYGKETFYLPWADVHRKSAATIQKAATHGGWHAYGEPRGSGKTSRAAWGGLWSILSGIHLYLLVIGANQKNAQNLCTLMYSQLVNNELLLEDFPHVCYPIRRREGETRKQKGQR